MKISEALNNLYLHYLNGSFYTGDYDCTMYREWVNSLDNYDLLDYLEYYGDEPPGAY